MHSTPGQTSAAVPQALGLKLPHSLLVLVLT